MTGKNILVVEDNESMQRMYRNILSGLFPECGIDIASDGAVAMSSIEAKHYDLVITDLGMPVLDGRQLYLNTQVIYMTRKQNMPPFLFCSGSMAALNEIDTICMFSFNRILLKPFSFEDLTRAIEEMLESPGISCVPA